MVNIKLNGHCECSQRTEDDTEVKGVALQLINVTEDDLKDPEFRNFVHERINESLNDALSKRGKTTGKKKLSEEEFVDKIFDNFLEGKSPESSMQEITQDYDVDHLDIDELLGLAKIRAMKRLRSDPEAVMKAMSNLSKWEDKPAAKDTTKTISYTFESGGKTETSVFRNVKAIKKNADGSHSLLLKNNCVTKVPAGFSHYKVRDDS